MVLRGPTQATASAGPQRVEDQLGALPGNFRLYTAGFRRGQRGIPGEYDEAKIALLAALIRPGTTFVDLGANIGFLSSAD